MPSAEAGGGLGSKWKGLDTEVLPCACGEGCYPKERSCIRYVGSVYTQERAEREELPPSEIFAEAADKTALIVMEL